MQSILDNSRSLRRRVELGFSCWLVTGDGMLVSRLVGAAALAAMGSAVVAVASSPAARGEDATFVMTLQNDSFTPAELKVPAGKPFVLKVINKEKAGVEIEAKDLKIEKVVAGNSEMIARVRAQKPGRYLLVNEYKEELVKAYIVVE
jgi:hypothetical protein